MIAQRFRQRRAIDVGVAAFGRECALLVRGVRCRSHSTSERLSVCVKLGAFDTFVCLSIYLFMSAHKS